MIHCNAGLSEQQISANSWVISGCWQFITWEAMGHRIHTVCMTRKQPLVVPVGPANQEGPNKLMTQSLLSQWGWPIKKVLPKLMTQSLLSKRSMYQGYE